MDRPKFKYFLICFCIGCFSYAQNFHQENLKTLDSLLGAGNLLRAQTIVSQHIDDLRSKRSYASLLDYLYYTGKINLQLKGPRSAENAVTDFIRLITALTDSVPVLRQLKLEQAKFYELVNNPQKAYDSNLEALAFTHKWAGSTQEDYGLIENNLGTLANRKGDIGLGLKHHNKALEHYRNYAGADKINLYNIYNSLGGSLWQVSKIDSALYYYQKAESILKTMEPTPINSYYRPAVLNNNIAAIYGSQGNPGKALGAMKLTIDNLNTFIKADISDARKESAKEFLFMAIDNYAGIYKGMGDYEKAKELIEYAYREKLKHFDPENREIYKSKILLGQTYLALYDYELSESYLDAGIAHIKRVDEGNNYWAADAHYSKAILNEKLGRIDTAKYYYQEAEHLYENTLDGAYDELYLDFIINASHFYAKNQEREKALAISNRAYNYVLNNQGSTTSFEIQQNLNIGEIHYELGNYSEALAKGDATEELIKKKLPGQSDQLDSANIILYKPQTLLLKARSAYRLRAKKDVPFLKREFGTIKEAITILESQKQWIGNDNNLSILIERNTKIFEFAKQLALELYEATGERTYLNELVNLHESIIYNRIRARMGQKTSMGYANLPDDVIEKEQLIKQELKDALTKTNNMDAVLRANTEWESYLKMLREVYPKYYKLRFASISGSLEDLEYNLPEQTTVVRYMYTPLQLCAVVISKKGTRIIKIDQTDIQEQILRLMDGNSLFGDNFATLNDLYNKLWKPLEAHINTDHVVIVPDRDLFNLNFEMLTDKVVKSHKELAGSSLLAKNIISYNYSLSLVANRERATQYNHNFIAFVPEFDDRMKSDYKFLIQDSLYLDRAYLTLLPQPFSRDLAKNSTRLFKGTSFLNENASKQIFTHSAKEHKIIHIGTHAESNNLSPELSRLIFAKSLDSLNTNDNYLYTYEIYNINLSSNLAILTACETGKPTYRAGEGMISLAHAFNYAGSESILTSLWKIDERSSVQIIERFYGYIKKGWSKDTALRQAKLDYLEKAEGRTLHPQYWAGLILIGDVAPISLISNSNMIYWILGCVLVIILFLFRKGRGN